MRTLRTAGVTGIIRRPLSSLSPFAGPASRGCLRVNRAIAGLTLRFLVLVPALGAAENLRRAPVEAWPAAPPPDFSKVPGVVISHVPASTGFYVGSPSIVILPDGDYVVSHDSRRYKSPQHPLEDMTGDRTRVFRSRDRGRKWEHLTDLKAFWSSLFFHRGTLYLFGPSKVYGDVVIRRSADGGRTWTEPTAGSGILLANGDRYHCAPTPVIEHAGRLWRAMEQEIGGRTFLAFMMSAPAEADLLNPASWAASNRILPDKSWLGGRFNGWLEGNAVVTPEGAIVNMLRVEFNEPDEKSAVIRISADGSTASFGPAHGFISFPGGNKKFTIRFDPVSRLYWSLSSYVPSRHYDARPARVRNTLALVSSPDLAKWTVKSIVLYHSDVAKHGFHYVDWQFEGDDLVAAARTGFDDGLGGAIRAHDANFITFHRVENFRRRTMADSPPDSPLARPK